MSNMRVPQQGPQPSAASWKQEVTQATAERSFLTKVLEFFTRPTRTQAQAETAEQAFIKFYMAKVDKYRDQVAPQDLSALNDRAGQLFLQIVNEGFRPSRDNAVSRNDGNVSERTMREAIKTANSKANLALMELKAHAKRSAIGAKANADTRPQILPNL